MKRGARTLLIGGGVAGLATAAHLVQRGVRDVVLIEREAHLGTQASGRNAAILRTHAGDPATAALLTEGAAYLSAPPPGFAPGPLVDPVGLVLAGDGEARGAALLDGAALSARAPHLSPAGSRAWFFPRDGRLDVAALMEAWARAARAGGAAIETGAGATELLLEDGTVRGARLSTGETLRAERTALCAGGWAGRLGAAAGSRVVLEARRRHLLVTPPDRRVDPRWPVTWDDSCGFYARPESGGMLLCACDQAVVDPDHCPVDPGVAEGILARSERLLPALRDLQVAHLWCGMRTFAADERFAIGPDPDVEGLYWVAALGGHGMGASPAVGRIAAARLCGESAGSAVERAVDPGRLVPAAVR